MNSIILFLLKSVVVSGLFTTWYWLALRNKRLYNYNRFFLLFTLYASMQIPLFHFQWLTVQSASSGSSSPASVLLHVLSDNGARAPYAAAPGFSHTYNWSFIIFAIAASVSAILLAVLLARIIWVIRMSRKFPRRQVDGITLLGTDLPAAPFSFLTWLFWKDSILLETENGRLIFTHEMTHIKQGHTYDKLACQLLTCICWFNPFYWIIQKELGMIHEFIADEKAINGSDTDAFARMLLEMHNGGRYLAPQHYFFSSPIKRRLTMLQTSTKTSYATLRRMIVLPLAAGAVLIFSFTPLKERKNIEKADKKIVLVIDPGHGGNDAGAQYEGIKEKDVNLRIARRIQELSAQYNIETHLTRGGDETVSLQDRVDMSNRLHPDDFISVHVTDDSVRDLGKGNFDVAICLESPKVEQSKELGWAVSQHINKDGGTQKKKPSEKRLYVLRHNNAPAIIIEFGDIKNKEQMQWINDDAKLDELCNAVLAGVVESHKP